MSEAAFQSAFVRLLTDSAFRDSVIRRPKSTSSRGLSAREIRDLSELAQSPGIGVMHKLHLGFRLNKLLSMLPLTCRLLGNARLTREARRFWQERASASFYFLEEAAAFVEYLRARADSGLHVPYLGDVLAYEEALLVLKRPRRRDEPVPIVSVDFRHDPQLLLSALRRGERPHSVPRRRTRLLASLDETGEVRWTLARRN